MVWSDSGTKSISLMIAGSGLLQLRIRAMGFLATRVIIGRSRIVSSCSWKVMMLRDCLFYINAIIGCASGRTIYIWETLKIICKTLSTATEYVTERTIRTRSFLTTKLQNCGKNTKIPTSCKKNLLRNTA